MENRTLRRTCIVCPRGCALLVEIRDGKVLVEGNQCAKGEDYGLEEATLPRRILTTTVQTTTPGFPRLPVRSARPVPLADIPDLMHEIDSVIVRGPVRCGDAVASGLGSSKIALVATDDLAPGA